MTRCMVPFLIILFGTVSYAQEEYVASKNSNKYHYTSCRWAKRISPLNLVTFESVDEATKAGYVACKVCAPPMSGKAVNAKNEQTEPPVRKQSLESQKKTSRERLQCGATTKKGTRCKRMAQAGSDYCWQHQR